MWNENTILIEDKYTSPAKHFPRPKLCPWGVLNKDKCVMPCFLFDSMYCTYQIYSDTQEQAAKNWYKEVIK